MIALIHHQGNDQSTAGRIAGSGDVLRIKPDTLGVYQVVECMRGVLQGGRVWMFWRETVVHRYSKEGRVQEWKMVQS
jgi:hypothetical protein